MFDPLAPFTIEYKEMTCKVVQYDVQGSTVFMITFADQTPTLLITRAEGPGGKFWTSLPEGRQEEAEEAGEQVLQHLKKK